MLVGCVLWLAQILTLIAWGESNIRKTEEGQRVLDKLSSAGLFFLQWRAYADRKKELRSLGALAGWITLLSICIFQAVPSAAKPMVSCYCISFMALWLSIRIGTDVKAQVSEMLTMGVLFFSLPFILLFIDWLQVLPYSLLESFVAPVPAIKLLGYTGVELALFLAVLGGGSTLLMAIGGIVMFSILPLFILFVMVLMSKLSRDLLGWKTSKARNYVAVYAIVIGPTLAFLHTYQVF